MNGFFPPLTQIELMVGGLTKSLDELKAQRASKTRLSRAQLEGRIRHDIVTQTALMEGLAAAAAQTDVKSAVSKGYGPIKELYETAKKKNVEIGDAVENLARDMARNAFTLSDEASTVYLCEAALGYVSGRKPSSALAPLAFALVSGAPTLESPIFRGNVFYIGVKSGMSTPPEDQSKIAEAITNYFADAHDISVYGHLRNRPGAMNFLSKSPKFLRVNRVADVKLNNPNYGVQQ